MLKKSKPIVAPKMTEQPVPSCGVMTDKWKMGDEFMIPTSPSYKGIYKITKHYRDDRWWAYFPEVNIDLNTGEESMARPTKLHKALM